MNSAKIDWGQYIFCNKTNPTPNLIYQEIMEHFSSIYILVTTGAAGVPWCEVEIVREHVARCARTVACYPFPLGMMVAPQRWEGRASWAGNPRRCSIGKAATSCLVAEMEPPGAAVARQKTTGHRLPTTMNILLLCHTWTGSCHASSTTSGLGQCNIPQIF